MAVNGGYSVHGGSYAFEKGRHLEPLLQLNSGYTLNFNTNIAISQIHQYLEQTLKLTYLG